MAECPSLERIVTNKSARPGWLAQKLNSQDKSTLFAQIDTRKGVRKKLSWCYYMYLLIRVTAPILCLGFRLSPVILVRSPSQSLAILCCCSAYFIPFLLLLSSPRNTGTCIEYPAISPLRHLAAHSAPVSLPFQHCACARPVQRSRPAKFPQRASSLKFQSPGATLLLFTAPTASQPAYHPGPCFFSSSSVGTPKPILPTYLPSCRPCVRRPRRTPPPLARQLSSLKAHFSTLNPEAALLLRRL